MVPIVLLTILGAVFSLVLVFASKIFKIDEDANFKEIRSCLPGINCSVCGYANCDEYARGILNGEVLTKCLPGGKTTREKLEKALEDRK